MTKRHRQRRVARLNELPLPQHNKASRGGAPQPKCIICFSRATEREGKRKGERKGEREGEREERKGKSNRRHYVKQVFAQRRRLHRSSAAFQSFLLSLSVCVCARWIVAWQNCLLFPYAISPHIRPKSKEMLFPLPSSNNFSTYPLHLRGKKKQKRSLVAAPRCNSIQATLCFCCFVWYNFFSKTVHSHILYHFQSKKQATQKIQWPTKLMVHSTFSLWLKFDSKLWC